MKKIILSAAVTIFLTLGLAFPLKAETNIIEKCAIYGKLAEKAMTARQVGVPLQTMLDTVEDINSPTGKLILAIILEAYDTPMYSTEEYKEKNIRRFADMWLLGCIKSFSD